MTTLEHRRVAVFEDDPDKRSRWGAMIRRSGGIALEPTEAPPLGELGHYLDREEVSLMVCDHHLWDHDYASYSGAAALAEAYKFGCGGVLITRFEQEDSERTIREYRRWITSLLQPIELNPTVLKEKLLLADQEVRGRKPPRERLSYRTIMTVKRLVQAGEDIIVKVMMSQWDPSQEVGFPLSMLPEKMQSNALVGNLFIAHVNIETERPEDLFFEHFELPNPDVLEKSRALFGGA